MEEVTTYMEIDARCGLDYDRQTMKPKPAYFHITDPNPGGRFIPPDELERIHTKHFRMVVESFRVPPHFITVITRAQYLERSGRD